MDELVNVLYKTGMKTQNFIFSHVYGVPRGGSAIATHLAHHMNLDLLFELSDWSMNVPLDGLNLLVVDDIVDTGKTFSELSSELLDYADSCPTFSYKFLSINYKPRTIFKPDIFYRGVSNDTWVVYPWECDGACEEDRLDFQKRRGLIEEPK